MMSAAATKTKPRVMSRGGIIACTVLTLLTPVGLLLIHLARGNAEEVEHLYSRGFYHGMATALTALIETYSADREGALFGNGGHPAFAGGRCAGVPCPLDTGSHPAERTLVAGMLKAAVDHSFGGFGGILLVYSYRGS